MSFEFPFAIITNAGRFLLPDDIKSFSLVSRNSYESVIFHFYEILQSLYNLGIPFFTNLIDLKKLKALENLKGKYAKEHWCAIMEEGRKFHHMMRILMHPAHNLPANEMTTHNVLARFYELQFHYSLQLIEFYKRSPMDNSIKKAASLLSRAKNFRALDLVIEQTPMDTESKRLILADYARNLPEEDTKRKADFIENVQKYINQLPDSFSQAMAKISVNLSFSEKIFNNVYALISAINRSENKAYALIEFIKLNPSEEVIDEAKNLLSVLPPTPWLKREFIIALLIIKNTREVLLVPGSIASIVKTAVMTADEFTVLINLMLKNGLLIEVQQVINKVERWNQAMLVKALLANNMLKEACRLIKRINDPYLQAEALLELTKVQPSTKLLDKLQNSVNPKYFWRYSTLLFLKGDIKGAKNHIKDMGWEGLAPTALVEGLEIMFEQPLSIQFSPSRYAVINKLIEYYSNHTKQFILYPASRSIHADINRKTAKRLYEQSIKLTRPSEIALLFCEQNVRHTRREIILETKARENPDYVERDINSLTLNTILAQIREVFPITAGNKLHVIKKGLQSYVARVDNHTHFGFFVDKTRREKSRQANLALAKELLNELENQASDLEILSLFNEHGLNNRRQRIIDNTPDLKEARNKINSKELNQVLALFSP